MKYLVQIFLAMLLASSCYASVESIEPTDIQSKAVIEIVDRLAAMHYQDYELNDVMSQSLLEHYIDALDPAKSYLLQSDIDEFNQWANLFDDMLKQGDLSAGFAIYNRYRERAYERWETNIVLLEGDYVFDYELDEFLTLSHDERIWPGTSRDADEFWRKNIKASLLQLLLNNKEAEDARELLIKRYKRYLQQLEQRDTEDVFERFVNSFVSLYDPHTSYMSPRARDNFQIAMSLSLEGIGAVLQTDEDHTKVVSVIPKGPADKQGILQPGDKITSVAQGDEALVDVVGWRLDDVVQLIRGAKDTTVRLEIIPAKGSSSSSKVIAIVRDKIQLEELAAQSQIIEITDENDENHRFGVIEVPAFYMDVEAYQKRNPNFKSTTGDVKRLLDELLAENVDGIVLDLRNNGGGFLHEATLLTDLFIDPGPVVQVRHANQRISRRERSRREAYYKGPLVVLINRLSASASEIFAGAIQDYGRGLVVGSQSFGKGTVQSTSLVQKGMIKLTESKFYRVSGDSTQNRGVIPDVQFPSLYDIEEVGESSQENAMKWDQIAAVPHRMYNYLSLDINVLQDLHDKRLKDDPDLLHMTQELELFSRERENKQLSLNFQQRLDKKERYEADLLTLENNRRETKGLPVFASYEAWHPKEEQTELDIADDKDKPEKDDVVLSERDPLLYETGKVFVDYLNLGRQTHSMLVEARRQ